VSRRGFALLGAAGGAEADRAKLGKQAMTDNIGREKLKSFVERIERIEEDIDARSSDRKEVYAEAKEAGFDTKILRKVVALRKMDAAERREQAEILDLYMSALGMLSDTPLGKAAVEREFGGQSTVTMTVKGDDGKDITTGPFTTEDLKAAARFVKSPEGKKALREGSARA